MYLTQPIGNVLQKFNQQTINIIYEPHYNMIDILFGVCGLNLYAFDNEIKNHNIPTNISLSVLKSEQIDLFHFNLGISNNVLSYASNPKFISAHLNTLICIPNKKPPQLKKEDLLLIDRNLHRTKKLFFSQDHADSWRFHNTEVIEYGVPLDHFYVDASAERKNKVLLFNFNKANTEAVRIIAHILQNREVEFDIIETLPYNTHLIRDTLNKYAVCVELNEKSISNALVAIACGCNAVAHNSNGLSTTYDAVPNLHFGDTVQAMADRVIALIKQPEINDYTNYYQQHFNFEKFRTRLTSVISQLNSETFYI